MKKRILSILLTLALCLSLLPAMSLTAAAADGDKTIMWGVSGIDGGGADYVYFGNYQQTNAGTTAPSGTEGVDWIKNNVLNDQQVNDQGPYYYKEPVKWRVLDANNQDSTTTTTNSTTDAAMLLLSEQNLDVQFYVTTSRETTWKDCDLRDWLNRDFFADAFAANERAVIAATNVVNADNPEKGTEGGVDTVDQVFLLSIAEARNTDYGFPNNYDSAAARIATNTAYVYGGGTAKGNIEIGIGQADAWWLRSPGDTALIAAIVSKAGGINYNGRGVASRTVAVRPAFNLNLSSVLFTSAAGGSAQVDFGLAQNYAGSEWKLTLKDGNSFAQGVLVGNNPILVAGDTLTVTHKALSSFTDAGYTNVTAMLINAAGEIVCYGSISDNPSATSSTITIPDGLDTGTYTLSVYGEQWNGAYKTDYATGTPFTTTINVHKHSWAANWNSDITCHWHECVSGGCPVTANSAKGGYAAHSADASTGNCVCGFNPLTVTVSQRPASYTYGDTGVILSAAVTRIDSGSTNDAAYAWTKDGQSVSGNTNTLDISGLNVGDYTYTCTVTVDGYIKTDTVTVTVGKAASNPDNPILSDATVGDKVGRVTITHPGTGTSGTWAWSTDVSSGTQIDARRYAAKAIFTPSDTENYLPAERTLTIIAAPRELDGDMVSLSEYEMSYQGTEWKPEVRVIFDRLEFTENLDYTLTWSADCVNAGEKSVTITPKEGGRLTGNAVTETFTIEKMPEMTIDGGTVNVFYNAASPVTIDLEPLLQNVMIAGDNPQISEITAAGSDLILAHDGMTLSIQPNNIEGALAAPLEVTVNLQGFNNCVTVYVEFNVNVTDKIPVSISIGSALQDKAYDGEPLVIPPVTASDDYTGEFVYEWQMKNDAGEYEPLSEAPKNVGEYRLCVSVADTAHYLGEATRDVTITPRTLTITAEDKEAYVSSEQPELTYTVEGLVDGDALTAIPTLSTDADMKRTGTYDIIPSGAEASDNYSITYVNGTLTVKNYPYLPIIPSDLTYPPVVEESENGDVTVTPKNPEKGDTVTIFPAPDNGYEVDEVIVTDKNGNPVTVVDNGDGTYSFKQPNGKVNIEATFKEIVKVCPGDKTCPMYGYTDLDRTAWYHDGIHYCIEHGLMGSTVAGQRIFTPNAPMTRAMIVTILWRLEGSPLVDEQIDFADIPQDEWYAEAVRWAQANGIVLGYDGAFNPNDIINREQMVSILWRYAKYKDVDVSAGENTNILSYDDAFTIAEWAIPAMQWACGERLVTGIEDSNTMKLMPQDGTSRAQAAVILQRYCEATEK